MLGAEWCVAGDWNTTSKQKVGGSMVSGKNTTTQSLHVGGRMVCGQDLKGLVLGMALLPWDA